MTNRTFPDDLFQVTRSLEFEEHGDMRIVRANWSGNRLSLRAQVDHGDGAHSVWQLRFTGVRESQLTVLVQCGLNIWQDHPAIDQYIQPRKKLHFGVAPANPDAVVGQLWAVHRQLVDDWIPFDRYINDELPLVKLLASSSGLLATGPEFLISAYKKVLRRNGCVPSTLTVREAQRSPSISLTHFGESFVIAEAVEVRRVAA